MGSITVSVQLGIVVRKAGPVDVVKPEHNWIDEKLSAWGRWARGKAARIRCGSIEGQYRAPWRQWHYPSIEELMPPMPNPELRQLDRAVLRVPEGHQLAIKLHYAFMAPPQVVCRKCRLRPNGFATWMHDARAMALNNLRLLETKA